MRWLMIAFLVSLAALLVAAAGVARHIWLHRARLQSNPDAGTDSVPIGGSKAGRDSDEEIDRDL
jgi:hypothetical protein